METDNLNKDTKLRSYYLTEYGDDELGTEINPEADFMGLYEVLYNELDVYEYIGVIDSVIRERLFDALASLMDLDYEVVYDMWMNESKGLMENDEDDYEARVQAYEDMGMTRSDAQAAVDAEDIIAARKAKSLEENKANDSYKYYLKAGSQALSQVPSEQRGMVKSEIKTHLLNQVYDTDNLVPALDIINRTQNDENLQYKELMKDRLQLIAVSNILQYIDLLVKVKGVKDIKTAIKMIKSKESHREAIAKITSEHFLKMVEQMHDEGWASTLSENKDEDDSCWEGYEQYGMKMKDGQEVPNCVPIEENAKRRKTLKIEEGAINFTYSEDGYPTYAYIPEMDDDANGHHPSLTEILFFETEELVQRANDEIQDLAAEIGYEVSEKYGDTNQVEFFVEEGPIALKPGYYDGFTITIYFYDITFDVVPRDEEEKIKKEIIDFSLQKMKEIANQVPLQKVRFGGWTGPIIEEGNLEEGYREAVGLEGRIEDHRRADTDTVEMMLETFFNKSALTFEGLAVDSIPDALEFFIEEKGQEDVFANIFSGEQFNEIFRLSGSNAYPEDFAIVVFENTGTVLAITIGARWLDDIVNNNAEREGYHPFDPSFGDDWYNESYDMYEGAEEDMDELERLEMQHKALHDLAREYAIKNSKQEINSPEDIETVAIRKALDDGMTKLVKRMLEIEYQRKTSQRR